MAVCVEIPYLNVIFGFLDIVGCGNAFGVIVVYISYKAVCAFGRILVSKAAVCKVAVVL